jgi:dTDP-4-amino-4,6-dideoxygalactose transaminase
MSDVLAAFLFAQLEVSKQIQERRRRIWETYEERLREWSEANGVRRPTIPNYCDQAYHMYYLLLPTLELRQALIAHLKERGILSVFHYLPLHLSEVGRKHGGQPGGCPVTEQLSERLLRLPFYNELTEADQMRVVEGLLDFSCYEKSGHFPATKAPQVITTQ